MKFAAWQLILIESQDNDLCMKTCPGFFEDPDGWKYCVHFRDNKGELTGLPTSGPILRCEQCKATEQRKLLQMMEERDSPNWRNNYESNS
jgi:hypothetical protein